MAKTIDDIIYAFIKGRVFSELPWIWTSSVRSAPFEIILVRKGMGLDSSNIRRKYRRLEPSVG